MGLRRKKEKHTVADLRIGEEAVIESFSDAEMALKLMEMGCLPGEVIKVERLAPWGDPMAIEVQGYTLSLRIEEADTILVNPLD